MANSNRGAGPDKPSNNLLPHLTSLHHGASTCRVPMLHYCRYEFIGPTEIENLIDSFALASYSTRRSLRLQALVPRKSHSLRIMSIIYRGTVICLVAVRIIN